MTDAITAGSGLYNLHGERKYLTGEERRDFLRASLAMAQETSLFCRVLTYTGCRLSEALELTPQQLDAADVCIVFRSLKRRKLVYRAVPIPAKLMRELISHTWCMERTARIWSWNRTTAWRHVKPVFEAAGIQGAHASPKGLRHGYGIANAEHNVPPALTQCWMGHANLKTTGIYQQAIGREERRFARRTWQD